MAAGTSMRFNKVARKRYFREVWFTESDVRPVLVVVDPPGFDEATRLVESFIARMSGELLNETRLSAPQHAWEAIAYGSLSPAALRARLSGPSRSRAVRLLTTQDLPLREINSIANIGSLGGLPNPPKRRNLGGPGGNMRKFENMQYSRFDHAVRKLVPSVGKISYYPLVKKVGDAFAFALSLPFPELRDLPPNHLRIRIGVGNRVLTNHVHFIEMGDGSWLDFLSKQYCTSTSDVVELGCGCGRIARPLKGEWFRGTYVGVDLDREMIDYCRNHFPEEKFGFVLSPHQSKTYSPTKPAADSKAADRLVIAEKASKDFVFSISLYSHLLESEFKEYLRESERILRPGGLMYMTFFCIEHVVLGERWTFSHQIDNSYVESEQLPEAAVAYKEEYVRKLVQDVGFKNVTILPRKLQSGLVARK